MAIRPQTTLDDVKRLARQLGVTFTENRDSFDLDKSTSLEVHGTYHTNQTGINAAMSVLVHLQDGERQIAQIRRSIRRDPGIGTPKAFLLFFLAALVAYAVGTFSPEMRVIVGPLTICFLILMAVSGCVLLFGRIRKERRQGNRCSSSCSCSCSSPSVSPPSSVRRSTAISARFSGIFTGTR